jgi:hypothetical protein
VAGMNRRLHRWSPSALLLAGWLCVFLGERSFSGSTTGWTLEFVGAALLLAGLGFRIAEHLRSASLASRALLGGAAAAVGAVLAYEATAFLPDGVWTSVAWGACLALGLSAASVTAALEFAVAPVAHNPTYEARRVRSAAERGLGFGLFCLVLLSANFLATQHDVRLRWGAAGRSRPSPEARDAVQSLDAPVDVWLFFPRGNEVAPIVQDYLQPLEDDSTFLTVRTVDHALAGELAETAQVNDNGFLAVVRGDVAESVRIGTTETAARGSLRRLDRSFAEALLRVTSVRKVAYFTEGHGERPTRPRATRDGRASARVLRRQLEALQYEVRPLGLEEGLADRVPEDADVVFVLGPEQAFLPAEERALLSHLKGGGRLFVALDAGETSPLPQLLSAAGLAFDPTVLANPRAHVQLTQTRADRMAIATNAVEQHPATDRLAANRGLYTVFLRSGALAITEEPGGHGLKTETLVRSLPGTFADADGSLSPQRGEDVGSVPLMAAVTSTVTPDEDGGRMVVLADVDVVSDDLIQLIQGNALLLVDALRWLQRDSEPVLALPEDDDVKIVHRREEDLAIFYGTTFGIPLLVLILGWWAQRRRPR